MRWCKDGVDVEENGQCFEKSKLNKESKEYCFIETWGVGNCEEKKEKVGIVCDKKRGMKMEKWKQRKQRHTQTHKTGMSDIKKNKSEIVIDIK